MRTGQSPSRTPGCAAFERKRSRPQRQPRTSAWKSSASGVRYKAPANQSLNNFSRVDVARRAIARLMAGWETPKKISGSDCRAGAHDGIEGLDLVELHSALHNMDA